MLYYLNSPDVNKYRHIHVNPNDNLVNFGLVKDQCFRGKRLIIR